MNVLSSQSITDSKKNGSRQNSDSSDSDSSSRASALLSDALMNFAIVSFITNLFICDALDSIGKVQAIETASEKKKLLVLRAKKG